MDTQGGPRKAGNGGLAGGCHVAGRTAGSVQWFPPAQAVTFRSRQPPPHSARPQPTLTSQASSKRELLPASVCFYRASPFSLLLES